MIESTFLSLCESSLTDLFEKIENLDKNSKLDVEYSDGILTIIVEETSQAYVINRHAASQKIWYSSPLSGANYFACEEQSGKWFDSKGQELEEKLFAELQTFIS